MRRRLKSLKEMSSRPKSILARNVKEKRKKKRSVVFVCLCVYAYGFSFYIIRIVVQEEHLKQLSSLRDEIKQLKYELAKKDSEFTESKDTLCVYI